MVTNEFPSLFKCYETQQINNEVGNEETPEFHNGNPSSRTSICKFNFEFPPSKEFLRGPP